MKKLLALALMGTFTLSVLGQGVVQFNNRVTASGVDAPIMYSPTGLPADAVKVDGATYPDIRAALYGGAASATAIQDAANLGTVSLLASSGAATWDTFRTGAAAGYVTPGTDPGRVVSGVDWGGQALVQMVGWKGAYDNFADAVAGGADIGWSPAITVTLPAGPTSVEQTYLSGITGFTIMPTVPEPSTFALAGLGAAALLIFRRRK